MTQIDIYDLLTPDDLTSVNFRFWLGDKPENAHATAWADIETRGTDA